MAHGDVALRDYWLRRLRALPSKSPNPYPSKHSMSSFRIGSDPVTIATMDAGAPYVIRDVQSCLVPH